MQKKFNFINILGGLKPFNFKATDQLARRIATEKVNNEE